MKVTLPMGFVGVFLGFLICFFLASTDYSLPESLRSQPVLVSAVYVQFSVYGDNLQALRAGLFSAGFIILTAMIALILWRLLSTTRLEELDDITPPKPIQRTRGIQLLRLMGWGMALLPPTLILWALVSTSGGPQGYLVVWQETWNLTKEELFFSLQNSALSGLLCVIIGGILGTALFYSPYPMIWRVILLSVFLLPGPILGVAIKILLSQPLTGPLAPIDPIIANLNRSLAPLHFAWILQFAPIVALLTEIQLRRIPKNYFEAVTLESRSPINHIRVWGVSQLFPVLLVGFFLVFILTIGEAGASILLLPPGPTTLSVRLLTLMHFAPTGQVSTMSLLLAAPGILVAIIAIVCGIFMTRSENSDARR